MWKFDKIEFSDFFSHVDSKYEFNNGACTLIVGENRDNGGNNGAGKSTLFEAIALALTNKSLRDLKKESFINRDAESCEIKLHMSNDVIKSTLVITRKFFRGNKSAKVEIIENGELNSTIVSVDEANKRIFELIGISREDLLRYFIISQDNNYTFFTAGDVEKKEVLNRITSADMINPILDKLSNDKKIQEKERRDVNENIISLQSKIETYEENIRELDEKDNIKQEIEALNEQIDKHKDKISSTENDIKELEVEKNKLSAQLNNVKVDDSSSLDKQLQKLKKSKDEAEQERSENLRIIRIAQSDLDGAITCPNCKETFIKDSQLDLSVEETKEIIKSAKSAVKNNDEIINKIIKQINEIKEKINEISEKEFQREKIQKNINKINSQINDLNDEIQSLNRKISNRIKDIEELKSQRRNDVTRTSFINKIKECKNELEKLMKRGAEIDDELELINYWIYYMGRSGFTTFMANKAISVLEGTVNSFLKKFKSNLSVNINGFKILRDGSVREKIEIFALENGLNAEAFMSKSGGERGRINLAGVLAIQHLINLSSEGRGLQALMLDETFAGIDSEGQESIIKILENLGMTVLMITQNVSSEFNNENKLVVVKEDGVSRFI